MFDGLNRFSFDLLQRMERQYREKDIQLAGSVVYLPLALLRSVALGATRNGLTQALRMNTLLTEEQRQQWCEQLLATLDGTGASFGGTLVMKSPWALSQSFVERATRQYRFGTQEEDISQLQVRTRFTHTISLAEQGRVRHHNRVTGTWVPSIDGRLAVMALAPSAPQFWQKHDTPLVNLLGKLEEAFWLEWCGRFEQGDPEQPVAALLPGKLAGTCDVTPLFEGLDLGPAISPLADFSAMMASGNAPFLTGLRHGFNLALTGSAVGATPKPMLWFVVDIASKLVLALGVHRGDA